MRKVTGDRQPGNKQFHLSLICFPLFWGENISLGQLSSSSPITSYPDYSVDEVFRVVHQTDNLYLYNFIFFLRCLLLYLPGKCLSKYLYFQERELRYINLRMTATSTIKWHKGLLQTSAALPGNFFSSYKHQFTKTRNMQGKKPLLVKHKSGNVSQPWDGSASQKGNQKSTLKSQRLQHSPQNQSAMSEVLL